MSAVITLRFHEYNPDKARTMLNAARAFAVEKIDGRPGHRYGTVYRWGDYLTVLVYWTKARTIVVVEQVKP